MRKAPQEAAWPGMARIPGGSFVMGSDQHYPEERPARSVAVDSFLLDIHPVTNAAFREFVEATGHVTVAERPSYPPGSSASVWPAGSLVFVPPGHPVPLTNPARWWRFIPGACWRRPEGPGSTLEEREDHPVVHVALGDALTYAAWVGKRLPSEAEWERAARGGLHGAEFAWGDQEHPEGRLMANTWQGRFPWENLLEDGYARTSPVGRFPLSDFGLSDMIGNVWEWTADSVATDADHRKKGTCCGAVGEQGEIRHVIKGGSHLCAPRYCARARPAARQFQEVDSSASHLGFRCAR